MSYKEWFNGMAAKFGMSESDMDLIMFNQGIKSHECADVTTAKTALVKEFALMIPMANVTEGGYSVSWNMEAVKLWYNATCGELGIEPATTPRIRNKSYKW